MRQLTTFLLFFITINFLYAQQFDIVGQKKNGPVFNAHGNEYDVVDTKVRNYGPDYYSSIVLAEQILKDFTDKKDRIRALYTWLCLNVKYDLASYNSGQTEIGFSYTSKADFNRKMKSINKKIVNKTLKTKKAVCEGYAQTFKRVSEQLGIQCKVIGGYAKSDVGDINNPPKEENHAWNAVKIDEKWYLVDAAWGAGYDKGKRWRALFDDFYFFTDPDKFKLTHYPTENKWFLTDSKLTKKQFYGMPVYKKSFFTNQLNLISPKSGVIEVATNNDITFLMGKIPKNIQLYYAFKNDKFSEKIRINCNDAQCNFTIPFTKKTDSELYIFANKKPVLEFFVRRK